MEYPAQESIKLLVSIKLNNMDKVNVKDDFDSLEEIELKPSDFKNTQKIITKNLKMQSYHLEKGRFEICFKGIDVDDTMLFEVHPYIGNNGVYSISGSFIIGFPLSLTGEIGLNQESFDIAVEAILIELQ